MGFSPFSAHTKQTGLTTLYCLFIYSLTSASGSVLPRLQQIRSSQRSSGPFLDSRYLRQLLFLPERPTHFHRRDGDGKRNILWGWPYGGQFTLSTQLINPKLCMQICVGFKTSRFFSSGELFTGTRQTVFYVVSNKAPAIFNDVYATSRQVLLFHFSVSDVFVNVCCFALFTV